MQPLSAGPIWPRPSKVAPVVFENCASVPTPCLVKLSHLCPSTATFPSCRPWELCFRAYTMPSQTLLSAVDIHCSLGGDVLTLNLSQGKVTISFLCALSCRFDFCCIFAHLQTLHEEDLQVFTDSFFSGRLYELRIYNNCRVTQKSGHRENVSF